MGLTHPARALHTDVAGLDPTRRAVCNLVPQLVKIGGPSDATVELTAILHGNCTRRKSHISVLRARKLHGLQSQQAEVCSLKKLLTPAVLGQPAHVRGKPIDVDMFTVKIRTLLLSEVFLAFWTGISVT